jgi:hypothetical protein
MLAILTVIPPRFGRVVGIVDVLATWTARMGR